MVVDEFGAALGSGAVLMNVSDNACILDFEIIK